MFYETEFGFNNFDDGHWRFQLRGKDGRWIKMHGLCSFTFTKPGDKTIYTAHGTFEGNKRQGWPTIRIGEDQELAPGDYEVDARYVVAVKAIIPKSALPNKEKPLNEQENALQEAANDRLQITTTASELRPGDIVKQDTEAGLFGEITSSEPGDGQVKINVKWSDNASYDMELPNDQKVQVWSKTKSERDQLQEPVDAPIEDSKWLEDAKANYDANRALMNGDSSAPTDFIPRDTMFDGFDGAFSKFVPGDPNDPNSRGTVERTDAPNQKFVNYNGRITTLVDINGVKVPFYLSSGAGGKKDVEAGKWYPFFGIGSEQDWYNKANSKYINNYYGSPELRAQAEWLDNNVGDVRNDKTIPGVPAAKQDTFRDAINQDVHPTDNKQDGEPGAENLDALMKANIADVISRIRKAPEESKTV
jgi:hypothetical protein